MHSRLLAGLLCRSALLLVVAASVTQAQGNASAAATAMGDNYTALARNFNAVAWNPANLGLPGNSRFSIAFSPQVAGGTGPITLKDLNDYSGVVVPDQVKAQWLQRVVDNGSQDLGGDIHITPLAFSIGRFAVAATTTIRAEGDIPPAVAELLLYGNAGRTGVAQDYTLESMRLDANATSTVGISYGRKVGLVPIGDLAIGVTGKWVMGHGMASLRDNGSTITSDPVAVTIDAPMVVTDTAEVMNGRGVGFDIGATWVLGNLTASAVVHDIVSTFKWDTENLYYLPVRATFDQNDSESEIDSLLPLSSAPQPLRDQLRARITSAEVQPALALGVVWTGVSRLTLAADLRTRFGDGIDLGPKTQVGLGAELRLIPYVPLRAGVTSRGEAIRYSGGLGFEFGVVNLQAAAHTTSAEGRSDSGFGLTLSFGGK